MVRAADVDIGKRIGEVEQLVRDAQIRDGFPYEQRFLGMRIDLLTPSENRRHEVGATFRVADQVEALGEEQSRGQ